MPRNKKKEQHRKMETVRSFTQNVKVAVTLKEKPKAIFKHAKVVIAFFSQEKRIIRKNQKLLLDSIWMIRVR